MTLCNVNDCLVRDTGIDNLMFQGEFGLWDWGELDALAALDFIDPPTGEALRDVLIGKNGKIPSEGAPAQILRWKPQSSRDRPAQTGAVRFVQMAASKEARA
jgi:hypothetical protein